MKYSPTAVVLAGLLVLGGVAAATASVSDSAFGRGTSESTVPSRTQWRPLDNDCSAGHVTFTFDDGPDVHTLQTMRTLRALHLKGDFFVEGHKLSGQPASQQIVRELASNGFAVENHTFDHRSITGATPATAPLTPRELIDQLERTSAEIVKAGLSKPTLYRPPFGDIDAPSDAVARRIGYRIVMSWGTPTGRIVDSRDWSGATAGDIVETVTKGRVAHGNTYPPMRDGSVIAMHDGLLEPSVRVIESLQPIVDWMNEQHLCSSGTVPADATGGVVPPTPPAAPKHGNLVQNASLESTRATDSRRGYEPECFQQAGDDIAGNSARWRQAFTEHSGNRAQRVYVADRTAGDRKLVVSQRESDAKCLARVSPGSSYGLWVHYRGRWAHVGDDATKVSLVAYYRDPSGEWRYWASGPVVAPSRTWTLAQFDTPPLPGGARAISFGVAIKGAGALAVDDFVMTER